MTALNLHKLMSDDVGYLRKLRVGAADEDDLRYARDEIKETLRSAFRNWESFVRRTELFDSAVMKADGFDEYVPVPKFRMQGSFTYFTANDCQFPPDQQIDMDMGVYLPLTFVMVGGRARPTIAANAYFMLVERALAPLCQAHGWNLNPTQPAKNTCVRVEISDRLHIDLPLYSIKDAAFEELVELAAQSQLRKAMEVRDSQDLDEEIYRRLSDAEIILAHRRRGWIESDPRRLERWFDQAIKLYGPVVRKLSRAFKGLRDAKWRTSDLGSICIMAGIVDVMGYIERPDPKRFDLTLVSVGKALADRMGKPVPNPGFPDDPDKHFCNEWTPEFRADVQAMFQTASEELSRAIHDAFHKGLAVERARQAFGSRVPNDTSLVELGSVAAVVRETPPQRQPEPITPRTRSG